MSKVNKLRLAIVAICVLILIISIAFIYGPKKIENNPNVDDIPNEVFEEYETYPDDEFYGKYETKLSDDDKNYIMNFKNSYAYPGMLDLWEAVADYKMSADFVVKDYSGKLISPVGENKPFIISFNSVYKDENGENKITPNSTDMAILKASSAETDPSVYILPSDYNFSNEDFLKIIANADYYNDMDRETSKLYGLSEKGYNVIIYFNGDGTPAFATADCNVIKVVDYSQTVFNQSLSMKEVLEKLKPIESVLE